MIFGPLSDYLLELGRQRFEAELLAVLMAHRDTGQRVGAGYPVCSCGQMPRDMEPHVVEEIVIALGGERR